MTPKNESAQLAGQALSTTSQATGTLAPAPDGDKHRRSAMGARAQRGDRAPGDAMPLEVVKMSDVKPEAIDWLWWGRIPRGMLTMLDGDPGLGKSTLICEIAACLSTGRPLPGMSQPVQTSVLLVNTEDANGCTTRPRLDAAGADAERVLTLKDPLIALPDCVPRIEETVRAHGIGLIVFDPMMAVLSASIDSHRDQDVRRALAPLAAMAARCKVAVVLVRHLNKAIGGPALYRGGGSIGIIGTARCGLLLASDPADPTLRILATPKRNLTPDLRALRLAVVSAGDVGRIDWRGECDIDPDRLCAPPESEESRSAVDDGCDFLRRFLADGPQPEAMCRQQAEQEGIKLGTLKRAKQRLGIASTKGSGPGAPWSWALPVAPLAPLAPLSAASDGGRR